MKQRHRGWVRRLWPFLWVHRTNVVIAIVSSIAGAGLLQAITPLVERTIIDDSIVRHTRPLAPWLALLLAFGVANFASSYVRRFIGGRVSLDFQHDVRMAIYERLQRLDFARHDEMQTGQLVSRANSDLALLQQLLSFIPIVLGNVVQLVIAMIVMLVLSPPLFLVGAVTLPTLMFLSLRLRRTVFPASWDAQQRAAEVAGVVDEAVSGVRVVKAFGQEEHELDRLASVAGDLYRSRLRAIRLQARYQPMLAAVPSLAQVAVLALGGWLAMRDHLTLGTFLVFSSYMVQMVAPVRMAATILAFAAQARAGAERVLDILDSTPMVQQRADATDLSMSAADVEFDGITFGYMSAEPVLSDFTLRVEPGETVALVGSSGSGKSTVALLLPRFYDVQRGAVRVGGTDVRDVTLDSLRRRIGVVFEDSFLFSDSVQANIAYGRPDASPEAIEVAARAAEAHEFIMSLPDGYDTVVGEHGLTLSGGQRQRIALARALITDPSILILDDATSSIDAQTEDEIHHTLRRVMARRTTLLVAHRRSTLRLADRIVVVDGGSVVAEGSHEELLARSSLYRRLLGGDGPTCEDAEQPDAAGLGAPTVGAGSVGIGAGAGAAAGGAAAGGAAAGGAAPGGAAPGGAAGGGAAAGGGHEGAADAWRPGVVTPSAWPDVDHGDLRPVAAMGGPSLARGGGGGGRAGGAGGGGGQFAQMLSATPELLEQVAALPPAVGDPDVDVDAQRSDTGSFRLRDFVRPFRRPLGAGLLLVVVDTLVTLAGPLLVKQGIDAGVQHHAERALWLASGLFLVSVIADWGLTWSYTVYTGKTAQRLLFALRIRIFAHLQLLGLDFYEREMAGRIMTRMITDVEALNQLIQTGLISAIVSIGQCGGVIVLLIVISPPLALTVALVLPPLVLGTWWFWVTSQRAYAAGRDRIAAVNANLQESLSGVRVAQAFVREERNIDVFRDVATGYLDARLRAQRLIALYFPFVLLLSDVASALVLGRASALSAHKAVTIGVVLAFILWLDQFFSPIQQLSQVFDTYQQAAASIEKIDELMAIQTSTPLSAAPTPVPALHGRIEFRAVHFSYPTASEEALRGVDLTIEAGQTVALVGETGAGKSTLVKLVARFYDATGGAVLVDGCDIRDLDLAAYRHQIGSVPQEAFLFTGTIRDNIAYGRPEACDADVEAAARAVGAHDFIAGLAHGYRTEVAERGRSLSGGQRQLIALARAQLVDPAILLLDEATSQLDLATEAAVQQAMGVLAHGRTTLIVAHRLQTARQADRIVVIDRGLIVEAGTHEELLGHGGRYVELWNAFSGEAPATAAAG